ncbi:F-type H+-transporting ATPase subunit b [Ereboglobus sp. PH5-10]|uniref:F0F1 ATP synthase subunit B n=1 Tax=Ereboglobus sp. PH5-10 TaxID=2940629 RepID=UPI0024050AF1|nr:F0F1 ATP synthase subunit B [Ereboglobus sp. PH5-10]MDF9826206.1 F-type H+-transporting ATPase subunit b [Ereboglobus sp. PH5-10]
MLSPLLILAEATVPHPESAGGITQIVHKFGIDWPNLTAQIISFSVVAYILWRFAFKPILATLDTRQKKIDEGIKYAEQMKAELAASQQKQEAILREAQTKAQQIIADTQKTAKEYADKQQQEAVVRATDIVAKAQQAVELEHKKMLADARGEIARLVVATTERVLAKKLSDADRASYNETAAQELTNV